MKVLPKIWNIVLNIWYSFIMQKSQTSQNFHFNGKVSKSPNFGQNLHIPAGILFFSQNNSSLS